jgi:hypothetical protein
MLFIFRKKEKFILNFFILTSYSSTFYDAFFVPNIKNISPIYHKENKKVRQQKNKQRWIGSFCWVNSPFAGLYHPFVYKKILSSITLLEFFFLKFFRFSFFNSTYLL